MLKKMTPEEAVARSGNEDVRYMINVGSSLQGSKKSVEFAGKFSNVFYRYTYSYRYAEKNDT